MGRPKNIRHDGRRCLSHRRGLQILPPSPNRLLPNSLKLSPDVGAQHCCAPCPQVHLISHRFVGLRCSDHFIKSPDTSQKMHRSTVETCPRSLPSIPRSNASPRAPSFHSSRPPWPLALRPTLPPAAAASHKPKPILPSQLSFISRTAAYPPPLHQSMRSRERDVPETLLG